MARAEHKPEHKHEHKPKHKPEHKLGHKYSHASEASDGEICAPSLHLKRGWEIAERDATDESLFHNRREILRKFGGGIGASVGLSALGFLASACSEAKESQLDKAQQKWADLYPAPRNDSYKVARELTAEKEVLKYNNFYEFGSHKTISRAAQKMVLEPWSIAISGLVETPRKVSFDDLLKAMPLEQRVLRHRCVEAWAMTVPWSGFPLKALIDYARPLSSARYIAFETQMDKDAMPGLRQSYYPWPYREGISMAEGTNELAFIATAAYGKPVAKQNGAPLRLLLPWKYGFKSIKSLVRISFVKERPQTFWEDIAPKEYGFWANVNPKVPHLRWSQAQERLLGKSGKVPTRIFNGYGEFVASIYSDMKKKERLYI